MIEYLFDQKFLRLVLKDIIENNKTKYIVIFKPEYFCDDLEAREIFRYIKERFHKDLKIPSYEKIARNVGGSFNPSLSIKDDGVWGVFHDKEELPESKKKIISAIQEIKNMKGVGPEGEEEFEEKIKDFIQWINSRMFVMKMLDDITKGTIDSDEYQFFVNKIKSVDQKDQFDVTISFEDYDKEKCYKELPRVNTGFPTLDKWMDGGLHSGEVGIIVGETGIGKSFFLVNLAKTAYLLGKDVVFVTLEIGKREIRERFDTYLSGWDRDYIEENFDDFKSIIDKKRNKNNKLIIIKCPERSVTVGDIKLKIEELKQTVKKENGEFFNPELLLLDYLEFLKLHDYIDKKYDAMGYAVGELRKLGTEENLAIWTVQQSNRNAYGKVPKMEDTQASIMIAQTVDAWLGLSYVSGQNKDVLRINIEKLRRSKSRRGKFIYLKPNFALSRIEEMPEFEEVKKRKKKKLK